MYEVPVVVSVGRPIYARRNDNHNRRVRTCSNGIVGVTTHPVSYLGSTVSKTFSKTSSYQNEANLPKFLQTLLLHFGVFSCAKFKGCSSRNTRLPAIQWVNTFLGIYLHIFAMNKINKTMIPLESFSTNIISYKALLSEWTYLSTIFGHS